MKDCDLEIVVGLIILFLHYEFVNDIYFEATH